MSDIFNLEQVYAEIRQKHPLLTISLPTISLPTISLPTISIQPKRIQPQSIPFIFFMDLSGTPFNKRTIGNDLIQTSSSSLYDSLRSISGEFILENYIGKHSSNVTVYNYDVHNDANGNDLYHSFVQTVYRLPDGTIGISHTPQLQYHFNDFYELSNNYIEIAPITFGTGNYLNKNGFVVILTGYTFLKMLIVFINN